MNSSSAALHSDAGCPQCPLYFKRLLAPPLHSAAFVLSLSLRLAIRAAISVGETPSKRKEQQQQQQQQQEGVVTGRLLLFDIYKSLSEKRMMHIPASVCACECN